MFRIVLPGTDAALPLLADMLGAFARAAAMGERAHHDLSLLLEELVANAVSHGSRSGAGPIGIAVRALPTGLRVGWCDGGEPFDPLAFLPPTPPPGLAEARVGGAGIALVRRLIRAGRYRRFAGRNVLTLFLREQRD